LSEPTIHVDDDDDDVRQALKAMIEALGMHAELYGSGEEFLAAGEVRGGGCILIDVRMPGLSGLELVTRLAGRGSKLPVIMISGHGDESMVPEAGKMGVVDFNPKPFRLDVLRHAIDRALDRDT
jgi:FixJ family two-component response regulator